MAKGWISIGLLLALLAAGCRTTPWSERADGLFALPASYGTNHIAAGSVEEWCFDLNSPELATLMERAVTGNLELRIAWARLQQAQAIARQAGAALWPTVDLQASATRSKSSFGSFGNLGGGTGAGLPGGGVFPGGELDEAVNQYRLSLGAAYELDLWGRLSKTRRAARLDARAARADAQSLAVSLMAQVSETWFDWVAQRQTLDLLQEQIRTSERFLELTTLRFTQGQGTALDAFQQRQQTESLRGQLAQTQGAAEVAAHQLAVLLGRPPQEPLPARESELPELPPLPDPGLPADLLLRRPDLRAAWLRLRAQDVRVAAAAADRLPRVVLSADLFFFERTLSTLFDELLYSVSAFITQPVFDGGRRGAEVRRAEAAAEEQLYQYGQTLLTSLREVQDALVREARTAEFVQSLERQLASARDVLRLARERYAQGAADYLRVLTALQSLQQIQQTLIEGRRQQLSHRIQLCRALGGGWSGQIGPPPRGS